jgi:hypothetical protein
MDLSPSQCYKSRPSSILDFHNTATTASTATTATDDYGDDDDNDNGNNVLIMRNINQMKYLGDSSS